MIEKQLRVSPTHLSLLLFNPARLAQVELEDMKTRSSCPPTKPYTNRAIANRRSILRSLLLTVKTAISGLLLAGLLTFAPGYSHPAISLFLATAGAIFVLFGTLSLGDAATQSLEGTSLIERTNKAFYELCLCVGTACLVAAGIVAL